MENSREEAYTDEEWDNAASKAERIAKTAPYHMKSKYKTAILISSLDAAIGWIIVALGVFATLVLYAESQNGVFILAGLGISMFGLLIVTVAQIIRATVDTANNTAHIAQLLEENRRP